MIYLDSSVVLSHLLAENRQPDPALWHEPLLSSRLLEYEVWVRIHAAGLTRTHSDEVDRFLHRIELLEMTPDILRRAIEPFPIPLRTLDALHLASLDHAQRQFGAGAVRLASYDKRLLVAAQAAGFEVHSL